MSDPTIYPVYEFLREFIRAAGPRGTINVLAHPWSIWWRGGAIEMAVKSGYLIETGPNPDTGHDRFSVTDNGYTYLDSFRDEYDAYLRDKMRSETVFDEYADDDDGETYPIELTSTGFKPVDFTVDLRAGQREAQERVAAERLAAQKASDEAKSFYANNALFGAI